MSSSSSSELGHGVDIVFETEEGIGESGEGVAEGLEGMGKSGLKWRVGDRWMIHQGH